MPTGASRQKKPINTNNKKMCNADILLNPSETETAWILIASDYSLAGGDPMH
jgi:hypothetical protein